MRQRPLVSRFLPLPVRNLAWTTALVFALGVGCQTFSSSEGAPLEPLGPDASTDAEASTPDTGTPVADGATEEPAASCVATKAPGQPPSNDAVTTLYASAATRGFPFALASDARYLYWLEQSSANIPDATSYNGGGVARLLRVEKSGSGEVAVLADTLPQATSLTRDGDDLYVATLGASGGAALLRVPTTCAMPPCTPAPVHPFSVRIDEVVRVARGLLYARAQNGSVFRIELGTNAPNVTQWESMPSEPPGMAVSPDRVFVAAGGQQSSIYAFDPRGGRQTLDAEGGARNIATDCTSLWLSRGPSLLQLDFSARGIGMARSAPLANRNHNVFDMAADAAYVYFAYPDAGGVYAMSRDPSKNTSYTIYEGNVHALHVDDDGVYWGEHADNGEKLADGKSFRTGRILMMRK